MWLIDRFLEEQDRDIKNVENVGDPPSTFSTKLQQSENNDNNDRRKVESGEIFGQNDKKMTAVNIDKYNECDHGGENVENAACVYACKDSDSDVFFSNEYQPESMVAEVPTRAQATFSTNRIGDCEHCSAAGEWDWKGPGLWCFHRAYFLGKPGHPKQCEQIRTNCPLNSVQGP